jgi:UDP-3-O-[3-hydroxymyristoyl] N-acetylglucosamine deacetylase/3-hydroxyacyl-[acyl-carrier-protein] dehydratase
MHLKKGQGMQQAKRRQRTLAHATEVRGQGFFHGSEVTVRFRPADSGTGVVFERTDLPGRPRVPARIDRVIPSARRTTIRQGDATVEMTEHVMAALSGMRVDNCVVEIDAAECPGCDGSSRAFVEAFERVGFIEQDRMRDVLVLESSVVVREGGASLVANPGPAGELTLAYHLDYGPDAPIHPHSFCAGLNPETFKDQIAPSRTFVTEEEANALRAAGIGLRTTAADLLIFGRAGLIGNSLRYHDECARHKVLDLLGDLALLGFDLEGLILARRSGHQTNHALARRLFEQSIPGRARSAISSRACEQPPAIDIQGVMSLLPHRYPFLLVDRVLELEPHCRAMAVKNVSINEPFFAGHWPGLPIMPGVLILESLAQAAGILIGASIHLPEGRVALIASIDGVKLRRPVVPGDQLRLEVRSQRIKNSSACINGKASVGESLAAEAQFRFVILDGARVASSVSALSSSPSANHKGA